MSTRETCLLTGMADLTGNLDQYLLKTVPASIYYIPDFITQSEEEQLIHHVNSAPKPKWTQLAHRRLQNWGGLPHPKGMIAEKLPQRLQVYAEKIAALGAFEDKVPNHVLVNEYLPGQGIMPHEDGPLFYPTVSTISLGSHILLDFYTHINTQSTDTTQEISADPGAATSFEDRHFASILLEPRSLILVKDDMYKIHLHGIAERTEDTVTDKVANINCTTASLGDSLTRTTRISLTIRHVPKVLKNKFLLGRKR